MAQPIVVVSSLACSSVRPAAGLCEPSPTVAASITTAAEIWLVINAASRLVAAFAKVACCRGRICCSRGWAVSAKQPRRVSSPNAVAQADASLERHRKLFTWGHITEAEYMREAERLTELRDQLRGAAMIRPTVRVKGVDDLWMRSNAVERRALLSEMFDSLTISDGEIVYFVPRADREGEVVGLVERAIPEA